MCHISSGQLQLVEQNYAIRRRRVRPLEAGHVPLHNDPDLTPVQPISAHCTHANTSVDSRFRPPPSDTETNTDKHELRRPHI